MKYIQRLIAARKQYDDDGFTLLELVVALSILMIVMGIGMFTYSGIEERAKAAAVESAAAQIFRAATAYDISGDSAADAVREYNESQMYNDTKIVAHYEELPSYEDSSGTRIRITTFYDDPNGEYIAIRETPAQNESDRWESDGGRLLPPEGRTNVNMTYQCNETKSGHLAVVNTSPETVVTMWEAESPSTSLRTVDYVSPNDRRAQHFDLRPEARQEIYRTRLAEHLGDYEAATKETDRMITEHGAKNEHSTWSVDRTIHNVSAQVTMEAGVEYTLTYDGQVETFSAPGHRPTENSPYSLADCLVSIDHFGEDTNLKQLTYLGGDNLRGVPDNLPASVMSLRAAFENAVNLNDPNIRSWNMENVFITRSMFYNAASFNQNISTWIDPETNREYWQTDNILDSRMMFHDAVSFNNGEAPGRSGAPLRWNTSNIYNMRSMFSKARSFNQNISNWNVSGVEDARGWDNNTTLFEARHKPRF